MATAKMKVYPYVTINEEGEVEYNVRTEAYRSREAEALGGSVSDYSNLMYIHLPAFEVEVTLPPDQDIKAKAVQILRAQRDKLSAAHRVQLTKMQFMENKLLALGAPEVLEVTPKGGLDSSHFFPAGEDDDIPF